jgi:3-phenylpropionate/cinnamic acid dioxygenase small subunit
MMTATSQKTTAPASDFKAIETLLYDEADCLDRADLKAWLTHYTEDGIYWMPQSPEQDDPTTQISLFYDDRLLMEIRQLNFASPLAASMAYDVRASHIIGNIRVREWNAKDGSCQVTSNFHAALLFRAEQTIYAGRYTHDLKLTDDGWKIRRKRVDLINCDCPLKSLVIYL